MCHQYPIWKARSTVAYRNRLVQLTRDRLARFLQRFPPRSNQASKLVVFETEIGVKYRFGCFDSDRFSEYVIRELPFTSAGLCLSDLVMPLDLLRNRYTLCGTALPQSAHFRLMEEIENGTLTSDSEYVSRCKMGTLDARLPSNLEPEFLIRQYQLRKEKLVRNGVTTISVIKVSLKGKPTYIIADGKHRAALVAYLGRLDSLRIRLLSNKFAQEPFFQQVFSYALSLGSGEYSINQEMIRAILNES